LKFYLKIYKTSSERSVAVCDTEIKGVMLKHRGVNIRVKEEYYGDDIYHPDEVLMEVRRSTSVNAFGKNICDLLVKHNLVHPQAILWFDHQDEKTGHVIIVK
jgi:hypothetical protein